MSAHIDHVTVDPVALGIDIGRTKIAYASVDRRGNVVGAVAEVPAPQSGDFPALTESLKRITEEAMSGPGPDITTVGVGTADMVEWPDGVIVTESPDQTKSQRFPLQEFLAGITGLPAAVDGDGNAAAYAEARCGAAQGTSNFLLVTVGTGVGGGLFFDGSPYHGAGGLAGEVGHLTVNPLGTRCPCGNIGCLESLASGTALGRNGRRVAARHPSSVLARLATTADDVTGETVWEAARLGDPLAIALFEQHGFWLGLGIASLVTVLDPQLVIIGGGLIRTGDLLLEPIRQSFEEHVFARDQRSIPAIAAAWHGAYAGVVGAGMLAHDRFTHAEPAATIGTH